MCRRARQCYCSLFAASWRSIDLISKLGTEEGLAEEFSGLEATFATLGRWASDSCFPSAWSETDVCCFASALAGLTIAWIGQVDFKAKLTSLVLRWVRPLMVPEHVTSHAAPLLDAIM